jgi:hypothetical protein
MSHVELDVIAVRRVQRQIEPDQEKSGNQFIGWAVMHFIMLIKFDASAAPTTILPMTKSIILVLALTVMVMMLVSCASDSDTTTPDATTQQLAPAHDHIGGM